MAGSYCTYAVRFDGSVASIGEGSYGRLGHGGSENESNLRNISTLQGIVTCMPCEYSYTFYPRFNQSEKCLVIFGNVLILCSVSSLDFVWMFIHY